MHIERVCFILPANSGEINLSHDRKPEKPKTKQDAAEKHSYRDCGRRVLNLFRELLSRFYASKWTKFLHQDGMKSQQSGVFFDTDGVELFDKVGRDNPRIFSSSELYIGSNGFSENEVLGSGGFGRVYRAVLPSDGTVVAVKCLAEKGERFEKTFAAELMAVANLRHRNLVRLKGWCVHEDELLLVYDYMPNRSLDRILFKKPEKGMASSTLSWERRKKIVSGLAAALHYLHEQLETQIIHRDVKTSNVMLDSQFNARLGDFGLARWLEHELQYYQPEKLSLKKNANGFHLADTTRIGGTIGYLPPESFQRQGGVATVKSDVFSFGIVVLEVASGRRAVDLTYPDDQIVLLDWIRRLSDERKLLYAGDERLQDGSYMLSEMERMFRLGLLCTLHNPQSRPNMKWIVEALSDSSRKLPDLPSFQSHPLYISLSSPTISTTTGTTATRSSTTTTNTVTSISSHYVTAYKETMYATAELPEDEVSSNSPLPKTRCRSMKHFLVDTPREISYKELAIATDNFSDSRRVAELDFGTAYHGVLENNQHILVKRLGMTKCPALRARFSTELDNLGRLRHRNLVQLRGWCTEQGEMLVVYDFSMSRLLSHLLFHHDDRNRTSRTRPVLKWHHRYSIIKSLASAILYLHEEWDEQVIHRNITSSAIVIDPDMNPRLTSFALAEFLTRNDDAHHAAASNSERSVRGIFGYLSPEYIESGEVTPMADVYSFGVVILEVVTGQMAVDLRRPEGLLVRKIFEVVEQKRSLEEVADPRLDGEYDRRELIRLVKLGISCTSSNPGSRPTTRKIASILDGNDQYFSEVKKEGNAEWKQQNATSLSMIRGMHALGIQ